MQKSEREHRDDIIRIGRLMFEKGWVASNDGNISVHLDAGRILATPTGVSKGMMHPDDLIVSINDRPVPNVDAFIRVMHDLIAQRPKVVRIFVKRDYLTHFVFIEPDWSRLSVSH